MIREHGPVILRAAVPQYGLRPGDIGYVVHIYQGAAAYEVEFMTLAGETVTVETLRSDQVRAADRAEIPSARLANVHLSI